MKTATGLSIVVLAIAGPCLLSWACASQLSAADRKAGAAAAATSVEKLNRKPVSKRAEIKNLVDSAIEQTQYTLNYDPSYKKLDYPGGDVPLDRGVCADVIVRAYRTAGIDLQKEIHEDMARNFAAYPNRWGARRPDRNIDHRRVPNLMTFFNRRANSVAITKAPGDYLPGDVVAWELDNKLLHIGLVSDAVDESTQSYQIVHNIGAGARLESVLFAWKIIGHYRTWD
jgi:uncharacterized protein YijF (DUF1287 family)